MQYSTADPDFSPEENLQTRQRIESILEERRRNVQSLRNQREIHQQEREEYYENLKKQPRSKSRKLQEVKPPEVQIVGPETPISYLKKPFEIDHIEELDNLLSTNDNAVILFYRPDCIHCKMFEPTFKEIAADIHRTNLNGSVPIVLAKIDGKEHLAEINNLRPGFLGGEKGRGFPTILFKRWDKKAYIWDPAAPRTKENILAFMAQFFEDESLLPMVGDLSEIMDKDKPNPEFIYFYSDSVEVIPRFVRPIDPNLTDAFEGIKSLNMAFMTDPYFQKKGAAFPVNRMDRTDIKVPSIYVVEEDKEYPFRDAMKWVLDKVRERDENPEEIEEIENLEEEGEVEDPETNLENDNEEIEPSEY